MNFDDFRPGRLWEPLCTWGGGEGGIGHRFERVTWRVAQRLKR